MDEVTWSEAECSAVLKSSLDLDLVLYMQLKTPSEEVTSKILGLCGRIEQPLEIDINSSNFLEYFDIRDNHRRILCSVKDEVSKFRRWIQKFHMELSKLDPKDQADAVFEFQAFVKDQIDLACKRVSEKHQLEDALMSVHAEINAMGHIASLRLQLRSVLVSVRKFAMQYQCDMVSDFRKCPHCGEVWTKVIGCDKTTTCGNEVKLPDARRDSMATFTFEISDDELSVARTGSKTVKATAASGHRTSAGCGKDINWLEMKPVPAPESMKWEASPSADDIKLIVQSHEKSWLDYYRLQCTKILSTPA